MKNKTKDNFFSKINTREGSDRESDRKITRGDKLKEGLKNQNRLNRNEISKFTFAMFSLCHSLVNGLRKN